MLTAEYKREGLYKYCDMLSYVWKLMDSRQKSEYTDKEEKALIEKHKDTAHELIGVLLKDSESDS